jgi:hypothetical protein
VRQFNSPWKKIYGKDRKYTRRVDALKDRESKKASEAGGQGSKRSTEGHQQIT